MPSYAPTYTPRSKIGYIAAGITHHIQFRGPRGANGATMNAEFKALAFNVFDPFATLLADDFQWVSHDIALTDEDTFAPAELPNAVTGEKAVADFSAVAKVTATTFSGRSPGSRARCSLFGIWWPVDDPTFAAANGIITPAEAAAVATVAQQLTDHAKSGAGLAAAFYVRATVKVNDHLLKLVRRGFIG